MADVTAKFAVFFEDPFWVGVYERVDGGGYEACKITFGAQPKDYEVYAFLLENWDKLRFSPALEVKRLEDRKTNPKRMQREVKKQLQSGIGTKAQQALQRMREQQKQERQTHSKERREVEKEQRFALRLQKRREKHAGH